MADKDATPKRIPPLPEQNESAVDRSQSTGDTRPPTWPIVGIGASAGGLEPLQSFFDHLPPNSGLAFVVVQHLSPDFKSLMQELLSRHTTMGVHRVEEGMAVEPNSVYLIPPKKNMVIKDGHLLLKDQELRPGQGPNFPIDHFLDSLAQELGERAIGVILSGTGSDGTRGVRAINEAGGLVLIQDPETAQFDGMPRSAMATNLSHYVLPPDEMGRTLFEYVNNTNQVPANAPTVRRKAAEENLSQVISILKRDSTVDFSHYKTTTLSRRIERRMLIGRYHTIEDYVERLQQDPEERAALSRDLLISVTSFLRDPEAWDTLTERSLRPMVRDCQEGEPLRIWVTACATGEEVYTLAVLLLECMEEQQRSLEVKIFATDIDANALERAAAGIYSEAVALDLGRARLKRFFSLRNGMYHVNRHVREMVIFAPHDLTRDAPFTRMNLVICRNALIYMQPSLQQQVLAMLHFSLRVNGTLFLGSAETLTELDTEFKTIDRKWKIYEKRRDVRLPLHRSRQMMGPLTPVSTPVKLEPGARAIEMRVESTVSEAFSSYLRERGTVCMLINSDNTLSHVYGAAGELLTLPQGRGTLEATKIVPPELALPLNTALHRARREPTPVVYSGVRIGQGDRAKQVNLRVTSHRSQGVGPDYIMAVLEPPPVGTVSVTPEQLDVQSQAAQRIMDLEQELQQTKENLQATIEELETTNEEQQAANEELLASNEELQSTNEELHSVNEELHTVNSEYQSKIQELTDLNNDIDNLLRSTDIGTVFLDSNLRIRKFTPAATEVVNLLEQDLGRPIDHLSFSIDQPDLMDLVNQVLTTGQPISKRVHGLEERTLLMRLHPYRTDQGETKGVVLTFVDVSELDKVQEDLLEAQELLRGRTAELESANEDLSRLAAIVHSHQDAVLSIDLEGRITSWNPGAAFLYGYDAEEILGESVLTLVPPEERDAARTLLEQIQAGASPAPSNTQRLRKDGTLISVEITAFPVRDAQGTVTGIASVSRDMSARLTAQAERLRLAAVVRDSNDAITVQTLDGQILSWNRGAKRMYGYSEEEALKMNDLDLSPPELHDEKRALMRRLAQGELVESLDTQRITKDGRRLDVVITLAMLRDERGEPTLIATTERDMTARHAAERAIRDLSQRNQLLLDAVGDGICHCDADGRLVFANPSALRTLGWKLEEVRGRLLHELLTPRDEGGSIIAREQCPLCCAIAEGMTRRAEDALFWRKDGTSFPAEYTSTPLHDSDGNNNGAVIVFREITERRQSQAALQESEARFRAMFEQAAVGIAQVATTGRWLRVNDKLCDILGYRAEDLLRRTIQDVTHPEDLESDLSQNKRMLNGELDHVAVDKRFIRHDGRIVWANVAVSLVHDEGGIPRYFIHTIEDITHRKQMEETSTRLNRALRDTARKLQTRNQELQQVNADVEAFVYSASHDLRSPLINLRGFANRLEKRLGEIRAHLDAGTAGADAPPWAGEARDLLAQDVPQSLSRITQSVDRFGAIIDGLLKLSRAGQAEPELSSVDMEQLAEQVVSNFVPTIEQCEAQVTVHDMPAACGDVTSLSRVLTNLLGNALKYAAPDRAAVIEIGFAGREENMHRYFVRDNGIGIEPKHHERIFRIFQRLRPKETTGEGLGLAIAKKIIERHGGSLSVESEPGQGSTFSFTLLQPEAAEEKDLLDPLLQEQNRIVE
jgi:PAS domain S-box-containing protein